MFEKFFVPPEYPRPETGVITDDPQFLRASQWLEQAGDNPDAALIGVPYSALSLSGARCDLLPGEFRRQMWSFSTYAPSLGTDLEDLRVKDVGDVRHDLLQGHAPTVLDAIESALRELKTIYGDIPVVVLGGDNSITAPALKGLAGVDAGLITFDAHHDVREYETTGLSNGSPIRLLINEGLKGDRIWQIGIKDFANSPAYEDFAQDAGINVVRLPQVRESGVESVTKRALDHLSRDPIYVDIDLDVVDRGLAPGAPAAQPGGLHPSQIAKAAFDCGAHQDVVALDIVEVDPSRDLAATTVRLACLVALSFLAGVARRSRR